MKFCDALLRVPLRHAHLLGLERGVFLVVALAVDDELLFHAADAVEVFVGERLLALESLLARVELLEIDLVAVEVRAVDAGELDVAADRHAARAAHAGAVHHDGVERHHGLDAERPGGLGAGVHHRQRTDGDHQVGFVARRHLLKRGGDEAVPAVAAVVGADDQFVGVAAEFILPEHAVLAAKAHDRGGAIADLLECAQLREYRRNPQPAADQHHMPDFLDMLRQSERPDEILELVALIEVVAHFVRRLAERLDDHGDGAALAIIVGDGQRNALAALVETEHDEVARLRRLRDVGRVNLPEKCRVGKTFPANDRIHSSPWFGRGQGHRQKTKLFRRRS